jgi:hypothetical protein
MAIITPEIRQAIEAEGVPLRFEDPETRAAYVLIPAEQFEAIRAWLLSPEGEIRSLEPILADLASEDWEDASHYDR